MRRAVTMAALIPAAPLLQVTALIPAAALLLAAALLAGCQSGYDMRDQPRYKPLAESLFFSDSSSARPLAEGVVARPPADSPDAAYTDDPGEAAPTRLPVPVTADLIRRGQERYGIYCAPCHGLDGYGHGMVVARGFTAPPSFHTDSLRAVTDGRIYEVMTLGLGRMPAYRAQVAPADRWAIVAYIRALQLSQHAAVNGLSPDTRRKIEEASP